MGLPHDAEAMHTETALRELWSAITDLKSIVQDNYKTPSEEQYEKDKMRFQGIETALDRTKDCLTALKQRRTGVSKDST